MQMVMTIFKRSRGCEAEDHRSTMFFSILPGRLMVHDVFQRGRVMTSP